MNSTIEKDCLEAFIWIVTLHDFIHTLKRYNHPVQQNKQYHGKELLSTFHLNGYTSRFHPDSEVRTTWYSIIKGTTGNYCLNKTFSFTYTANGKRQIQVKNLSK